MATPVARGGAPYFPAGILRQVLRARLGISCVFCVLIAGACSRSQDEEASGLPAARASVPTAALGCFEVAPNGRMRAADSAWLANIISVKNREELVAARALRRANYRVTDVAHRSSPSQDERVFCWISLSSDSVHLSIGDAFTSQVFSFLPDSDLTHANLRITTDDDPRPYCVWPITLRRTICGKEPGRG